MKIGAQLFTVRAYAQNEKDLGRTLERVAAIGYRAVQLSAVGPIAPKRVKALCDENGLEIALTHNGEQKFLQNTDALIEEHQLYGCRYVGLGSMPDRYRSAAWVDYFARDFEAPAQKLADAGMKFMYHNHAFEFSRLPGGDTIMDRLLSALPAELMGVTADAYWLQYAGVDVNRWMAAHRDRLLCVHLKDLVPTLSETRMAAVGEGNINFEDILRTVSGNGVTEYAFVEQDNCYDQSPFDCLRTSFENLQKMGY